LNNNSSTPSHPSSPNPFTRFPKLSASRPPWRLKFNSKSKDKINIIHRPGRFNRNVDALSRFPSPTPAYHVLLLQVDKEWDNKLWQQYKEAPNFRRILTDLQNLQKQLEAARAKDTKRNRTLQKEGKSDKPMEKGRKCADAEVHTDPVSVTEVVWQGLSRGIGRAQN
jgi:hypothetical protein